MKVMLARSLHELAAYQFLFKQVLFSINFLNNLIVTNWAVFLLIFQLTNYLVVIMVVWYKKFRKTKISSKALLHQHVCLQQETHNQNTQNEKMIRFQLKKVKKIKSVCQRIDHLCSNKEQMIFDVITMSLDNTINVLIYLYCWIHKQC